ncbi:MAG: hypothetical protein ABJH05_04050 [Fulvivirga sp.]
MDFKEYLISKKIDAEAFKKSNPKVWTEWGRLFKEMHPKSFTAQKLYLINDIRRKYALKSDSNEKDQQSAVKKVSKPKVKPARPKTGAKPVMKRPKLK